jgi:hypothetical protein
MTTSKTVKNKGIVIQRRFQAPKNLVLSDLGNTPFPVIPDPIGNPEIFNTDPGFPLSRE